MIKIIEKKDCCGCSACVQICPKSCISFNEDNNGFWYPIVDENKCIGCNLCEKVCPCLNHDEPRLPIKVYAGINPIQNIRLQSSSGGIFTALAESVIQKNGVVFGAMFDQNWEVRHSSVESLEELSKLRGSKYVQSRIEEDYIKAKKFLEEGRSVLFTGTQCQIAGLKKFLRKDYENLLSVDVVCHGVPSPLVWREYLKYITARPTGALAGKNTVFQSLNGIPAIVGISFRDKRISWKKYGFSICYAATEGSGQNSVFQSVIDNHGKSNDFFESLKDNLYMEIFQHNLGLRPSCYSCPAKKGRSCSDITIADFWGITNYYPELDDDKGVSLIMAYTKRGHEIIEELNLELTPATYQEALAGNASIERSAMPTKYNDNFWPVFHKKGMRGCKKLIAKYYPSFFRRILSKIKRILLT